MSILRCWVVPMMMVAIFRPTTSLAHCDTMDGPVVADAKLALERSDVTPVLKWVLSEHEQEIRDLFAKTLLVRTKGPQARELADMYFFETVVRLHRAGEGAPYTGLKPAGADVDPAVAAADAALASESAEQIIKTLTDAVADGIRQRLRQAIEAKKHADQNVDAGREFVRAYVEFVHYVERIHKDALSVPSPHQHHEMAD